MAGSAFGKDGVKINKSLSAVNAAASKWTSKLGGSIAGPQPLLSNDQLRVAQNSTVKLSKVQQLQQSYV